MVATDIFDSREDLDQNPADGTDANDKDANNKDANNKDANDADDSEAENAQDIDGVDALESGKEHDEKIENGEQKAAETEAAETEQVGTGEKNEDDIQTGTLQNVKDTILSSPLVCVGIGVITTLLVVLLIMLLKRKMGADTQEESKETGDRMEEIKQNMYIHSEPQDDRPVVKENTVHRMSDMVSNPMKAASICGLGAREEQQDSFGFTDVSDLMLYRKKGMLAIVADGMGGLSNGGDVSSLVVRTCLKLFNMLPDTMASEDMLTELAKEANREVNRLLRDGQRSGSTLVAAIVRDSYLHFLTIGDSHIYLYRNGALIQLNREHIYREELTVRAVNGTTSVERANKDKQSKSLTSYLGIGKVPHIDRNQDGIRLVKGDRILMASDGVFGTLSIEQMEAALAFSADEAVKRMQEMVEKAGRKYQDNYTAVVLEYKG